MAGTNQQELENNLQALNEEIMRLHEEIEKQENLIESHGLASHRGKNTMGTEQLAGHEATITELQAQIKDKDAQFEALQSQLEAKPAQPKAQQATTASSSTKAPRVPPRALKPQQPPKTAEEIEGRIQNLNREIQIRSQLIVTAHRFQRPEAENEARTERSGLLEKKRGLEADLKKMQTKQPEPIENNYASVGQQNESTYGKLGPNSNRREGSTPSNKNLDRNKNKAIKRKPTEAAPQEKAPPMGLLARIFSAIARLLGLDKLNFRDKAMGALAAQAAGQKQPGIAVISAPQTSANVQIPHAAPRQPGGQPHSQGQPPSPIQGALQYMQHAQQQGGRQSMMHPQQAHPSSVLAQIHALTGGPQKFSPPPAYQGQQGGTHNHNAPPRPPKPGQGQQDAASETQATPPKRGPGH